MEMKEMVYSENGMNSELLYHEDFGDGTALAVINNSGFYPCAYIKFPGIDLIWDINNIVIDLDEDDDNTYVHGGFTFFGCRRSLGLDGGLWLGWDYGHYGDYVGGSSINDGYKWTTQEIVEEARRVLRYFREGKWYEERTEEDENEEDNKLTCSCCGSVIEEGWNFCPKCGSKLLILIS